MSQSGVNDLKRNSFNLSKAVSALSMTITAESVSVYLLRCINHDKETPSLYHRSVNFLVCKKKSTQAIY